MSTFAFNLQTFGDVTTTTSATQLKNLNVWSKEVAFKAMPNLRFFQFADVQDDLTKEAGETIQMLTYNNLKQGGKLTENVDMTTQAITGSLKEVKVTEYGNAVAVTEKLLRTSYDDTMARVSTLLGRDYALVLDCELRDVALTGTNVVYADKVVNRSGLASTNTLKVSTIKDAVEILSTNNAPKVGGANWVCFVHPHQSRGLRDDNAWINASNYGAPDQLFTGEIGRIDDTIFIETTLMKNGACAQTDPAYDADLKTGASGNQTNIYKAVIFGQSYYGLATALPVEIRDNGVEDFGRRRSLAWYSLFGVAKLNDEYGVVIETA
jgi:hypothetical protein